MPRTSYAMYMVALSLGLESFAWVASRYELSDHHITGATTPGDDLMPGQNGTTTVGQLTVAQLIGAIDGKGNFRLILPSFQRGVVWSPKKQADLIRSMKRGFPVGSLLVYERAGTTGRQELLLIDGLQRTTAIKEYTRRPLSFMAIDDLPPEPVLTLSNAIQVTTGRQNLIEKVRNAVDAWMNQVGTLDSRDGFDSQGLLHAIVERVETGAAMSSDAQVLKAARELIESIRGECDISGFALPLLTYRGSEGNLADIFESMNATGTKLSKYEVFAASWISQEVLVATEEVRDAIKRRYSALMEASNISINGVSPDGTPEDTSLFDYLFGLGKHLTDRFPLLFGTNEDPASMESVAFTLAASIFGLPLAQLSKLPTKFNRSGNCIDPGNFEAALLESVSFVDDVLSPFIGLKLNSERQYGAHTELQIVSIVSRAVVGRYESDTWETRPEADDDWESLRTELPRHYLADILQQNWRGSGDKRLYDMVWDTSESANLGRIPSTYYRGSISRLEFERILDQWFSDQLKVELRSRGYVTAPARTFLKFIYSGIVSVREERAVTFELDHVLPVSRLTDLAKLGPTGWPISAISNLALFDWKSNREKSKLDLVQYLMRIEDPVKREERKANIERFLLVEVDDAVLPTDAEGQDSLTREQYLAFLEMRFAAMKSTLLRALEYTA